MQIAEFFAWVKRTFTTSYQDEITSYLAQATDVCDLEYRMRQLIYKGML